MEACDHAVAALPFDAAVCACMPLRVRAAAFPLSRAENHAGGNEA